MKAQKDVPHKHLHSRISYLYQAATYLTNVYKTKPDIQHTESTRSSIEMMDDTVSRSDTGRKPLSSEALGPARVLLSNLRAVSLKTQIRLTPAIKSSICKRCDTLLVSSSTSTSRVENNSRGGNKAWADVLVVTCNSCGFVKRFPIGAKRQRRRAKRVMDTE